jgi:LDH2 family malate/lactate/ureidoglycolate dehydrogenase
MMKDNSVLIPVAILQSFMQDVFVGVGVPLEDAKIAAEVLITSDLRGIESHGIGRLKMYYDRIKTGQHQPITNIEVVRESPTTAVIDGHHGVGMIIGKRSMQMAIDKAHTYGMGSVAVRNSTHFGIDGYYALMAVKANMIGMSFTNARPSIAPTFGVQPMLGTNPIAFGCPTDEDCPFIFDGATSITQRGKFEVLARAEKKAPDGWVIDQQGLYITDPDEVLVGLGRDIAALLPLGGAGELGGGHKGYDLATIVEILSASLQTGAFLHGLTGFDKNGNRQPFKVGHFFMAIKIEAFVDLDQFKATTGEILRELRNSKRAPGQDRIYTAGEKEFEMEDKVREQGVAVNPNLQKEIKLMQQELGLTQYKFPF